MTAPSKLVVGRTSPRIIARSRFPTTPTGTTTETATPTSRKCYNRWQHKWKDDNDNNPVFLIGTGRMTRNLFSQSLFRAVSVKRATAGLIHHSDLGIISIALWRIGNYLNCSACRHLRAAREHYDSPQRKFPWNIERRISHLGKSVDRRPCSTKVESKWKKGVNEGKTKLVPPQGA